MELRPYQSQAIHEIRTHYSNGVKKVLLHLATGGGKTLIFSQIAKATLERGKRTVIVIRGRKLITQASHRLSKEGVPHGVYMANHRGFAPERLVQVCSIDTIRTRKQYPRADLVIIDEGHQATSPDYQALASHYEGAFFLPVTATPYGTKSLRHIAQEIVCPISVRELMNEGYLVDAKYYAPTVPDLTGVKIRAGEYVESDLEKVMGKKKIVGDVVDSYFSYAKGLPSLAFCVSIAHAQILCDKFNDAGVRACVLSAKDSDEARDYRIEDLKTGEVEVICNVGVMSTGVDIPWLQAIILARPTQSLNLHLQQLGRLTRPYPGKTHGIVLDHAGNLSRHGFMDDEHSANLDGAKTKFEKSDGVTTCKKCFGVYRKKESPECCPLCGHKPLLRESNLIPEVTPGELKELNRKLFTDTDRVKALITLYVDEVMTRVKADGSHYSPWWAYHKVKDQMKDAPESVILSYFKRECFKRGLSISTR